MTKSTAFVMDRFPFEKDWKIRVVLAGIDDGGAVYLETEFDGTKTRDEAEAMLDKIVKELPSVTAEHACVNCNSPAKYKCSECGKMFCDDCCGRDSDLEVTVCTECFCKPPNS